MIHLVGFHLLSWAIERRRGDRRGGEVRGEGGTNSER